MQGHAIACHKDTHSHHNNFFSREMVWPPTIPRGALDAAARRALALQRSTFLRMLNVERALTPVDSDDVQDARPKLPAGTESHVKKAVETAADAIITRHTEGLPQGCARAPGHLQLVALAIAAQRVLLSEARGGEYMITSALKTRSIVADALGVVAPADGTEPVAVPVMWLPNRIALGVTGGLWLPSRRRSMVERMMNNFEVDLGAAFVLEPLEPSPSRRLRQCFYRELLKREGDDAEVLSALFTALHAATWAGVPGFLFESDEETGACEFVFE